MTSYTSSLVLDPGMGTESTCRRNTEQIDNTELGMAVGKGEAKSMNALMPALLLSIAVWRNPKRSFI